MSTATTPVQQVKPLDPASPKGRKVAADLSAVIADVEAAIATRKAAEKRRSTA